MHVDHRVDIDLASVEDNANCGEQTRKKQEAQFSVGSKRAKTIVLYTKEREGKLSANYLRWSPKLNTCADPSSSAWGQIRHMMKEEAGGGRRDRWGQMRLVGAGEADRGGKPSASGQRPPASETKEAT